jgi:hypothetical protein
MAQVTWRAPDELVDRVRAVAAAEQRSVNDFLTQVMRAVTDPDLAGDAAARVRERLARAGLLAAPGAVRRRPDAGPVAAARRTAGTGTTLSELVVDDRG